MVTCLPNFFYPLLSASLYTYIEGGALFSNYVQILCLSFGPFNAFPNNMIILPFNDSYYHLRTFPHFFFSPCPFQFFSLFRMSPSISLVIMHSLASLLAVLLEITKCIFVLLKV